MSDSLSKKTFRVLQEDGVKTFSQKAIKFTYQRCGSIVLSARDNEINEFSAEKTHVASSESVSVTYDGGSETSLPPLLSRIRKEINTPERVVLEFEDTKLFDQPPLVNIGWKYFYPTSVGNSRYNFSLAKHSLQDLIPPISAVDRQIEFGFVIGGDRSGFAHWFYEQLPKLHWYTKYCMKTGNIPELIVSGELSKWQARSLELVGYPPEDYIQRRESEVIAIDRLLIPPHPRRTHGGEFQICPSAIEWVRDRITSNLPSTPTSFPNQVYVSRADADRRQVVNENEVVSLLNQYGFESFEPGRLSFDNQVRLFANADMIVGPHGAGLTHMIYGENLKTLELMTENSGAHFFVLANECNHPYDFLLCEPVGDENIKPRHKDMHVDIHSLEDRLDFFLDNP